MVAQFASPPDRDGFKLSVWAFVQLVPAGKVITYGQVAAQIGPPGGISNENFHAFGARWVGGAIATCPPGVPWHRVINSQGKISLPGAAGIEQRALLEAEGVVFDARGKIDLNRFGWKPKAEGQMELF